ncbi:MAG: hypothetical protein WBB37_05285 [bacterium]
MKSAEELAASRYKTMPLPESVLVIPEFDGKYPIPIIEFASDHFMESWHFIIYNDGSLFLDEKYIKKIPLVELKKLILELNNKGLYDISELGIILSLMDLKKMTILDVILPPPDRPLVPTTGIDGGTITIRIHLMEFNYYLSFYAIDIYYQEFPTSQDVQILWESIGYLQDSFRKFMEN